MIKHWNLLNDFAKMLKQSNWLVPQESNFWFARVGHTRVLA